MSYSAKGAKNGSKPGSKGTITLNDVGELGNSVEIYDASIKVKKGKIKIIGIDPFSDKVGSKNKKVTLVTAKFNPYESKIVLDSYKGYDLFGVSTKGIRCPEWDFCTDK